MSDPLKIIMDERYSMIVARCLMQFIKVELILCRLRFSMCVCVRELYISGIFCVLDDSVRLEYSMIPLSNAPVLQYRTEYLLRIPYIRDIL